jgi:8-oxo-dGTP pyrophosphatase MutT (NUDIX family)
MFNKIRTKNDGIVVIPIFSDDSLLLIETYRYGVDEVLLEFPGGLIEISEEPIGSARKELLQETDTFARHLNVWDGFTNGPPDVIKKYMYF